MQHLFLVHSGITYLVARQIIATEGLAPQDCAYALLRNFQPDPADPVPAAPLTMPALPLTWRLGTIRQRVAAFDAQVAHLTHGRPFAVYCPHTNNGAARLLASHPDCRELHYIEEGMAAYTAVAALPRPTVGKLPATLRRLLTGGRYHELDFYEPARYGRAFGISAHSFKELERRVVLPLPFRKIQGVTPDPTGQALIVLDALVEFGMVEREPLRQALHALFDELLARGFRQMLFKYHPVQARDPAKRAFYETEIFAPYADRLPATELVTTHSLEDLAFSYSGMTFGIVVSSGGLYAALCGQRVLTVAPLLAQLSPRFGAVVNRLPPVFYELTESVEMPAAATPSPAPTAAR